MTGWDLLFLAAGVALVLGGLWKGALRLAFGLAGLLAAFLYAGRAADWVATWIPAGTETARRSVAVIAGFVLILVLFILGGWLASALAKAAGLSLLNRVLGGFLGLLLAVVLAGGAVRTAGRLSPALRERMMAGVVVRTLSEWCVGLEALVPERPSPAPATDPSMPHPGEQIP
jgi:membrane protein required for colicin V production